MIDLLICLIIALLIAGAVLGVLHALLAIEPFKTSYAPFAQLIYALAVLLALLLVLGACLGGYIPHAWHVR